MNDNTQPQGEASGQVSGGGEVPHVCDGKEQDAFEAWARGMKYDMACHPIHWLFLNQRTHAARQGWKAGLTYAAALSTPQARPVVDEAMVQQVIANLNNATAVMRDRPHGGGPDRAWLTSQVNLLRAALAPQQPDKD